MPGIEISALPAAPSAQLTDVFPIDQLPGPVTFKLSASQLLSLFQTQIAVNGQALTKIDDTNVTLTLGGSPNIALLNAASITLGWTGLLATGRGGTGVSSVTITPTATAFAGWDANKNLSANNFLPDTTTITNSGTTTTLTIVSTYQQIFSGATFQTVQMPVVATLATGHSFRLINESSNSLFVISSGSNSIVTMQPLTQAILTFNGTVGTTAISWDVQYTSNTIGVQSITGTANQVIASSSTGNITLSLPQSIATTSTPTFGGLNLTSALTVPNGGTGDQSFTPYAVICGGTTSTSALQSIASVGSLGQIFVSNGPGALPTFQTITTGSGTVNAGLINQLAWYTANGSVVSGLTTANNGVLVTSGGGVPSISTTLPNGLAMGTPASLTLTNATGLVPSTGLSVSGTPSSTTFLRGDNIWATPTVSVTGFTLINQQLFITAASGTYVPTAGTNAIFVEVWGGGGGGGGVGWSSGFVSAAGGGGGGGFCSRFYSVLPTNLSYVVGSGGANGAAGNNNGTAGGTSSFGNVVADPTNYLAVNGGDGGIGSAGASSGTNTQTLISAGGLTAIGSTHTNSIFGGASVRGLTVTSQAIGGTGGNAGVGGSGGAGGANAVSAVVGIFPGGGGGGAASTTAATAGAPGRPGRIVIWEYH
jgi:hypothetical protein